MRSIIIEKIVDASDNPDMAVCGTGVLYTKSFNLSAGDYFGVSYVVTGGSAPDLLIQFCQSYKSPDTEGATEAAWVIPEAMADIVTSVTTTTMVHKALSPIPMPYGRFMITGNASNSVALAAEADLLVQLFDSDGTPASLGVAAGDVVNISGDCAGAFSGTYTVTSTSTYKNLADAIAVLINTNSATATCARQADGTLLVTADSTNAITGLVIETATRTNFDAAMDGIEGDYATDGTKNSEACKGGSTVNILMARQEG